MSGAAFEGLEQALSDEGTAESYEPGSRIDMSGLAEALVAPYADDTLIDMAIMQPFIMPEKYLMEGKNVLAAILKPRIGEGFDPTMLLDDVVHLLSGLPYTPLHSTFPHLLLDPLVQLLYDAGYNNFLIDLCQLPTPPANMAHFLRGEQKRPLLVKYLGDVSHAIGLRLRHARLEHDGSLVGEAPSIGYGSEMSRFILHGETDRAGGKARGCVFHFLREGHLPVQKKPRNHGCSFYSGKLALPRKEMERDGSILSQVASFAQRNRYYCGKDGAWQEVRP